MLEFRNPAFNVFGTIDLEINHPTHGWMPFTASPADPEKVGRELYALASEGDVAPYVAPDAAPIGLEDYRVAIDAHVNQVARSREYNDAATLAGYVSSTVAQWATDAAAFVAWRDAVWLYAFGELDKVQAAERPQPNVQEFLEELPAITW